MQKNKKPKVAPSVVYDFSTTQWLGADLKNLKEYLVENIDLISQYPEREADTLTRLLSRRLEVKEGTLIVTDGATGAFHLIASETQGAKSMILPPTNSEFMHALERAGHKVVEQEGVEDLAKLELKGIDYLWISNPNSPDGRFFSRRALLALLRENPETTIIVDLSMDNYVLEDNLKATDIKKYKNLIITSSFSKAYNLPGLRVGYVVAEPERIRAFHQDYTPRCVATLGLEAARYVLLHPAQFTIPIRKWLREANELAAKLSKLEGVKALPTHTPFFILELEELKAEDLAEFLMTEYNVKVGTMRDDIQLTPHQVRITAHPSSEASEALVDGVGAFVRQYLSQEGSEIL